tara:strand:- start:24208 stop:24360 length:153 start_codon:yes stop_codon:yes gene_type:complete
MSGREQINEFLKANGIDPDQEVATDSGTRTAYEITEAHLMAAMDEIEEGT